MKTLNIFFNSSDFCDNPIADVVVRSMDTFCNPSENEKKFRRDCKEKNIRTKVVKRGSGCKHCTGPYTYRWIETDSPMYILCLEQGESVDVFFYSEDDQTKFLDELAMKIPFKIINTFHPDWYYGMKELYEVKIMP
jgi:hypothetical protein